MPQPTNCRTVSRAEFLAILLLALFLSIPSPGALVAQQEQLSYRWGEEEVEFLVDREIFAIEVHGPLTAGELRQTLEAATSLRIAAIDETPLRGLFLIRVDASVTPVTIASVETISSLLDGGWATPCLRYRGILHLPRSEILVSLADDASRETLEELAALEGITFSREFPALSPLFLATTGASPVSSFEICRRLLDNPAVNAASPNFIIHTPPMAVPDDPLFPAQWHLQNTGQQGLAGIDIGVVDSWGLGTGSFAVTIAIIDEGVDVGHADLVTSLVAGHDSTNQPSPQGVPGNCATGDGHGTSCAGIAAGIGNNGIGISGVCWSASIMSVRVGFGSHWTQNDWIIDSLTWAVDNGADILSNSWGGGAPSTAEEDTIQYALTTGRGGLGAIVLFATGNDNTAVSYPAAYPGTIAVGATSPCDERKSPSSCDGETHWGSNFGDSVSVVAPGVKMTTTDISGADGFGPGDYINNFNGTSSATPVVAGAMGLLLAADMTLTVGEARQILEAAAVDQVGPASADTPGWDPEMGFGRIDVSNMLALLGGPAPPADLQCSETNGDLLMTWTNGALYDSVVIGRDGATVAVLGGGDLGYLDLSPPVGSHSYSVQGIVGASPSLSRNCNTFIVGSTTDLIWAPVDASGIVAGGLAIEEALLQNGRAAVRTASITTVPDLNAFDHIWVNLGVYPSTHVLSVTEGQLLANFLTDGIGGGMLYMEGGDTWFFDPPRSVHPHFGITATSDGPISGDLTAIVGAGAGPCDLTGLDLTYGGEDQSIDQLSPQGASVSTQSHPTAGYDLSIFRDSTTFRTLGASYELGGINNGVLTRNDLMAAWLSCFGSLVQPVSQLGCSQEGSNAFLTWIPEESYDSIEVRRDSALIATLPGAQETFLDVGVATGAHGYSIRGVLNSVASDPQSCLLDIRPLSVVSLECLANGGNTHLSWVNSGSYALIRIERQGTVIAALSGSATGYVDLSPGGGVHLYSVAAVDGGIAALPTSCTLSMPPEAPQSLTCSVNGEEVVLGWTNSESYDSLQLQRDGILIATFLAGTVSHVDGTANPGSHFYSLRGILGGISSSATSCSAVVVNPPVEGLTCSIDGSGQVLLGWVNAAVYSTIEVRRDGTLVATLAGSALSHVDNPIAGEHLYSVITQSGGLESSPALCSITVPLVGVASLTCSEQPGSVLLSWQNAADYDGIQLHRNGTLLTVLPGATSSYSDGSAPGGDQLYSLSPFLGSSVAAAEDCLVTVPLATVIALACVATNTVTSLSWQNGAAYSQILVRRDGIDLIVLPGVATAHSDSDPGTGAHSYEVLPSLGSLVASASSCAVVVPPSPVEALVCLPAAGSATLSWQMTGPSDGVEIYRDTVHLATLIGAATTFVDVDAAPGTHEWIVIVFSNGIESASSSCSATVLLPPVGAISCLGSPTGVLLEWTLAASYDAIEVRRDGGLLATLGGSQVSFIDVQATAGDFQYSIRALLETSAGQLEAETLCAVTVLPQPVSALVCNPVAVGVQLSWTNGGSYQQLLISRDGQLLATLAAGSTEYFDPALGGTHLWSVEGVIAGVSSEAATCSGSAPPPPVTDLSCVEEAGGALLNWTNGVAYDSIRIELNGVVEAILPAGTTRYLDAPGLGVNEYSVIANLLGADSAEVGCSLTLDLSPVTDLLCVADAQDVQLSWIPAAPYDGITIFRDGIELATLLGSASGYLDPGVPPGLHQYQVTASSAGFSSSATCSVTLVLPTPFIRSDGNGDGTLDISDPVLHLQWQFLGVAVGCLEALDSDGDGEAGLPDVIFSLAAVFGGGPSPAAPFPDCGVEATLGPLGCVSAPACP